VTVLLYVLGVLVFVVAILVSIGLHELGHMIPAKAFGGKVTQYFIGFGPTVWSRQIGETEYGVKAVPLGGYVKIVGMLPPAAEDLVDSVEVDADGNTVQRVRKSNTGLFTQLISNARSAEWELIGPEDSERLFYRMKPWKKIVVMAAGPSVNIVIAFLLFWGIYGTYGNAAESQAVPVVSEVNRCVLPADQAGRACRDGDQEAPAYAAGLRPADRVVSFNDTQIDSWDQLRGLIRDNADREARIVVERGGERVPLEPVDTIIDERPVSADSTETEAVGFMGFLPDLVAPTGGPLYTLEQMGDLTVQTVQALGTLPVKVYQVGEAVVGVRERAQDSPVSIVGGGRIAGETASSDAINVQEKVVGLVGLIAGFNFFIGVFNFVPLLPLDGGHIASALWEAARRRLARLRRRPDPGYVDAAKLLPVAYVVAGLFLVMGVVLILGDLVAPISIA